MQWVADPPADEAIAAVLGHWTVPDTARIDALNQTLRGWRDNADAAAQQLIPGADALPPWAERERIARAEAIFMEHGALSVTILFCASLPECYVVPDLAAVLHATGQLEDRAEHRIRTTGAMIFPVMMAGGLTRPDGSGVAQILKVRLIHATIRNMILRGSPEEVARMRAPIPCIACAAPPDSMHRALYIHGWDLGRCALPNNQEELAYTLLTFSYVFLRSMRRLGIPLTAQQEEDFLHAWNVAGHFLGIRRELMVDTMADAEALFTRMQERGRAQWAKRGDVPDPRPHLGRALMNAMQSVFPPGACQAFPVLLTRRLIEARSARELGLDTRVSTPAKLAFATLMGSVRAIDAVARLAFPDFSLSRLVTRAIGYRLTCMLLMSQTRELAVPASLRPGIRALIARWGRDTHASARMNALEDRFTTDGDWEALQRPAPR